jgi:hypothetical protein
LSREKRRQFFDHSLEQNVAVLFEEQKEGRWCGVTDNYIRVWAQSPHDLHNQWRTVRLEASDGQGMHGALNANR